VIMKRPFIRADQGLAQFPKHPLSHPPRGQTKLEGLPYSSRLVGAKYSLWRWCGVRLIVDANPDMYSVDRRST
jgi:hypothetical protein